MYFLLSRPVWATFLISAAVTAISLAVVFLAFRVVGTPVLPVVYFLTIVMPIAMTPPFVYPLIAMNRQQQQLTVELRHQAGTDALTGLPNRRAFFDFARGEMERSRAGEPFAALMIDIDNFKHVNDTYGHDHGDAVLMRVGEVIRAELAAARAPTAIVARMGGEEFAIVAVGLAPSAVARLAERICGQMHRDETGSGGSDAVTVSVGVALRKAGMEIDALLKAADDAVYAAKRAGRDRWAFSGDLPARADEDVPAKAVEDEAPRLTA